MKIQHSELSFNRALTSAEKQAYLSCINQAKRELNIKETIAILFDYSIPAEKNKNIGIGTSFSENAQKFVNFIKEYCGISAIQLNPQGILKDNSQSPYNATSLSIGEHIIDLFKLSCKEYENILPQNEINKFLLNENPDEKTRVCYDKLVRQDYKCKKENFVFSNLLTKAFSNFKKLSDKSLLVQEFKNFLKQNQYRLDSESLYYALAEKYHSTQWQNWDDYKYLFMNPDSPESKETVKKLKKELKSQIEYHNFVQFIADKQQKLSRNLFNKNGIKILGDIPISFSPSEQWANKSLFSKDYCFGFWDGAKYQDWGSPAPDLENFYKNKEGFLGLFKKRLFANLQRYDGIRIDVAWEMFNPIIVKWNQARSVGKNITNLGCRLFNTIETVGKHLFKDKYNSENIYLELLGGEEITSAIERTKNIYPHLLVNGTRDSVNNYVHGYHYKNGKFAIGIGTHDNPPLIETAERLKKPNVNYDREIQEDAKRLSINMKMFVNLLKAPSLYRILKLAELFTAEKQYMNIFDILGTKQCMNNWDSLQHEFWRDRIPINYEQMYFKNLTEGKGLNLPEALSYAIKAKFEKLTPTQNELIKNLGKFAQILKAPGAMTEQKANLSLKTSV